MLDIHGESEEDLMKVGKEFIDLLNIFSPSSGEEKVKQYFKSYISSFGKTFEVVCDQIGSIYAYKKGTKSSYKVMVSSHMDEVAYLVKRIKENGMIVLEPNGSINKDIPIGQVLSIYTNSGKLVKGVVPSLSAHLTNASNLEETLLDTGLSKQALISAGVELGNFVGFEKNVYYSDDEKRIISPGIDNKFGCYMALLAIAYVANKEYEYDLYIGANVMEEVGLRGSTTIGNLINPDVFINFDASPVDDTLSSEANGYLGKGPLFRVKDPGYNISPKFLNVLKSLVAKENIPYQIYFAGGGTDASTLIKSGKGAIGATIGLPTRYIHSSFSMADIDDIEKTKKLLFSFLDNINNYIKDLL